MERETPITLTDKKIINSANKRIPQQFPIKPKRSKLKHN